jgi:ADP-ribose pyrophosphatase YjhB (NUDIX family)
MWAGGVRVIILDGEGRALLVRQRHEGRDIWMLPGGAIEDGENALEAAEREVREETCLEVRVGRMLWHVEEVSPERGQRFVNIFTADVVGGEASVGSDPEFGSGSQVLNGIGYFSKEEIAGFEHVYPEALKGDMWKVIGKDCMGHSVFRLR